MTNISLTLSKKLDRVTVKLFSTISSASDQCGIEFVVIGATARDVILHYVYGIAIRRLTKDVDIAIIINEWGKFDKLKSALLATKSFSETRVQHRLIFHDTLPLDIVPFGEIARENHIHWPPDDAVQMNISGHQETLDNAVLINISEGIDPVRFSSLPNLTALKILAWKDRGKSNPKDATDVRIILDHYVAAGNRERLYDQHIDAVESVDYDEDLAGALLLGRDIKESIGDATRMQLTDILESETDELSNFHLALRMRTGSDLDGTEVNLMLTKLRLLKQGIE